MFAFQGINKDVFGGPMGVNQMALQMLVKGILEGQQKRNDHAQLSSLFGGQAGQRAEQQAQQMAPNVAMDVSSAYGGGVNGLPNSDQMNPSRFVDWILANPTISGRVKNQAINAVKAKSDLEYQQALTDKANRVETKPEDKRIIEYWKEDGTPGGKILVSDSQYNKVVGQLEKNGYIVQEPKGKDQPTSEFERLLEKSGMSEEKKKKIINQRILNTIRNGTDSDPTNKITLGDGQRVTLAELRAQYREKYNIPDEFELQMMQLSPDAAIREQAARLKAQAATQPSFVEFMMDAKKNGLEGIRPEKEKTKGPESTLPKGFVLEK